jgi:hypothetical protein
MTNDQATSAGWLDAVIRRTLVACSRLAANTAIATWQFGDDTEAAELRIARNGRLAEVRVNRWGNPGGAPFGRYPFGVRVEAESRFGGITIPSVFRAGWWWDTDRQHEGEFFRAEITGAVFS